VSGGGTAGATAGRTPAQNALIERSGILNSHRDIRDTTRLSRLPVDRRRNAGQAGSYA